MSISTRVLRKFQGDRDLVTANAEEGSDVDDAPFSGGARKKQLNVNRYDLLNQQSQSESEVKEDDDDNDLDTKHANAGHCEMRESTRRKKKKKRKKLSHSSQSQRQSSDDVDEVERSVREVNAILGDTVPQPSQDKENASVKSKGVKDILNLECKHLNPKNELKRIFGAKIVQTEQSKRRAHGRTHFKSMWLVTPKEHWPPIGKLGLSMKLVKTTKEGLQHFAYQHSPGYQNIEKKFLEAVESLDPDNIVAIANEHPYHVDTLIQLSDICKLSEDLAMAAELIERALHSLESAFHPLFNLAKGNMRLDYKQQENRAFYITLFKHLTYVGQRACYRTALEFCKLILALDPDDDPLAIVLIIDFYALRSREFTWFLDMVEEFDPKRNLSALPNIAFSKAVALFQLSDPAADGQLQEALLMFPSVLIPLLEKCGVQPDPKTNSSDYFRAICPFPALTQLTELYIHRCYHFWKEADTLAWLERNTLAVIERMNKSLEAEYNEKRLKRYDDKYSIQVERHIFLSDIKEVTALLSSSVGTTFSFDPLPPPDSINIYTRSERPPRVYNSNAVSLFFRSLMPTFDMEQPPAGENAEGGDGGEEGASGSVYLQRSVTSLLDAMRNLLSNLQQDAHISVSVLTDTQSTDSEYDDDEDD